MNVSCPDCQSAFRIDPAKVTSESLRARCSVCGGIIPVGAGAGWADAFTDTPRRVATPRAPAQVASPGPTNPSLPALGITRPNELSTPTGSQLILPGEPTRVPGAASPAAGAGTAVSTTSALPEVPRAVGTSAPTARAAPAPAAPAPAAPASEALARITPETVAAASTATDPAAIGREQHRDSAGRLSGPAEAATRAVAPLAPTPSHISASAVTPLATPVVLQGTGGAAVTGSAGPDSKVPERPAPLGRPTPIGRDRSSLATPRRLTPIGGNPSYHRGPTRPASPAFGAPLAPPPRTSIPTPVASPATPSDGNRTDTPPARRPINPFLANDPNQKARRLARALVSDMIAYHPAKREDGLRNGTLKHLFREEIKKSYEEYVDQIGREFAEATTHFQDALNDVLSGGRKLF